MVGGQTCHARPPRPTTAGSQVKAGTRLLLVEGDPDLRAMLSRLLDEEGYAITVAGDGQSALTQVVHRLG